MDKLETLHMIVKYDVVALISKIDTYCEIYDIPLKGIDINFRVNDSICHKIILKDDNELFIYD